MRVKGKVRRSSSGFVYFHLISVQTFRAAIQSRARPAAAVPKGSTSLTNGTVGIVGILQHGWSSPVGAPRDVHISYVCNMFLTSNMFHLTTQSSRYPLIWCLTPFKVEEVWYCRCERFTLSSRLHAPVCVCVATPCNLPSSTLWSALSHFSTHKSFTKLLPHLCFLCGSDECRCYPHTWACA